MFNSFAFSFSIEIYSLEIKNFKIIYLYIGLKKLIGRLYQVSGRKV